MKPYSIDLREKIVKAYSQGDTSVRKVAERFGVAKSFVQQLLLIKKTQGHVEPKQQGGTLKGELDECKAQLAAMVEKYPNATLLEYCEYWVTTYNHWLSTLFNASCLAKTPTHSKKKTIRSRQAQTKKFPKFES